MDGYVAAKVNARWRCGHLGVEVEVEMKFLIEIKTERS